ncbi:MAG: hypothetical protein AAF153_02035 [Pseudomonadota bacterium]
MSLYNVKKKEKLLKEIAKKIVAEEVAAKAAEETTAEEIEDNTASTGWLKSAYSVFKSIYNFFSGSNQNNEESLDEGDFVNSDPFNDTADVIFE